MRILLIAELANPDWVSVPLEGYCLYEALSRVADVHLVTQVRNEENLRKAGVAADWFTALDNRSVEQPLYRAAAFLRGTKDPGGVGQTINTALSTFAYYWFEVMLWRRFGGRIRAREFDVVHRLTPLSPTIPSVIAPGCAKAGVPFVVGPLNGGLPWPRMFSRERHQEKEWLTYVRDGYKLMPGYRSTRRRAAAIIAGSRDTLRQVASAYREKCVYIPENGLDPKRFDLSGSAASSEPVAAPLRVAFVGRMVPYKLPGLVLDAALPLLQQNLAHVDFYGDGPELPKLKEKVAAEGLSGAVTFHGGFATTSSARASPKPTSSPFPASASSAARWCWRRWRRGSCPSWSTTEVPGSTSARAPGMPSPWARRRRSSRASAQRCRSCFTTRRRSAPWARRRGSACAGTTPGTRRRRRSWRSIAGSWASAASPTSACRCRIDSFQLAARPALKGPGYAWEAG